ncbi:polysaccharide lyase family 7 protein [Nonomuraea rosea]|uniref:Polysaccharide lyase family 7 protein n=1 Tax=Nonomuraea rosea TaxID=638574 RepID=A0ABP6X717_9ACTN
MKVSLTLLLIVASVTTGAPVAHAATGPCRYPADVLDLANWKVALPVDDPALAGVQPLETRQPALASYSLPPYFQVAPGCNGVQFRAPVNGVTQGSSFPRSELREMNGTAKAAWTSTSGVHTMVIRQAITSLPADKTQVMTGQVHNATDEIAAFRLEGRNLFVSNGPQSQYKLVTGDYRLGTVFETKFVVGGGQIKAYYNNVLQATITRNFADAYFKAGMYTLANCALSAPCSTSNYGQSVIHDLRITHTS